MSLFELEGFRDIFDEACSAAGTLPSASVEDILRRAGLTFGAQQRVQL